MRLRSYNLIAWVPHLFLFYQEKVFRKLFPIMSIITLYAVLIAYADTSSGFLQRFVNPNLNQFHLIFSFILTIIISFRINTSYARWWEARTLWGSLVNNCRNLALKFDTFIGLNTHPQFFAALQALPSLLKAHLRKDKKALEAGLKQLGEEANTPVFLILKPMYATINQCRDNNIIRWEQYTALDNHLAALTDIIGGCERIANTPVPHAFAVFVKQALLFYALMFPFGWVDTFGFLIIPIMIMIVYVLLGLEILSEELEEPFESEDGLHLDLITQNIINNIEKIAGKSQ